MISVRLFFHGAFILLVSACVINKNLAKAEFIENKSSRKFVKLHCVKISKSTMALFRPIAGLLMSSSRTLPALSSRLYHEKVITSNHAIFYLHYLILNCFSKVIDHYEKPRNVGKLDAKKRTVGTGLVGAPACGDVMKLQVSL